MDFWIEALFAWIFGFHGWALLLPQAIAGVCSVAVLYHLVKRIFGQVAGLIAAAVMALTPIAVAVQRTNEVDGMLVLFMLLTSWCLWKAIETKKLRWLLWAGVLEGIGFNIKMMEAYLILPALYVGYYFATKLNWRKKIVHLLSMSIVLGAISFSWAAAVDLTPASDRPYVGSTQDNSEMSLIFGYNGISRLTGDRFGGHAAAYHSGNSAQSGGQYNTGPHNPICPVQYGRWLWRESIWWKRWILQKWYERQWGLRSSGVANSETTPAGSTDSGWAGTSVVEACLVRERRASYDCFSPL